jgi:hypothetical protein
MKAGLKALEDLGILFLRFLMFQEDLKKLFM